MQNRLAGGEGVEGTYGSITQAGMRSVLEVWEECAGFGSRSVMLDIGSGLGRYVCTRRAIQRSRS